MNIGLGSKFRKGKEKLNSSLIVRLIKVGFLRIITSSKAINRKLQIRSLSFVWRTSTESMLVGEWSILGFWSRDIPAMSKNPSTICLIVVTETLLISEYFSLYNKAGFLSPLRSLYLVSFFSMYFESKSSAAFLEIFK